MNTENTSARKESQARSRPDPLPESGRYTADDWAEILDITPKTLLKLADEHKVHLIRLGRLVIVDAAKFWDAFEKPPSKSRGAK